MRNVNRKTWFLRGFALVLAGAGLFMGATITSRVLIERRTALEIAKANPDFHRISVAVLLNWLGKVHQPPSFLESWFPKQFYVEAFGLASGDRYPLAVRGFEILGSEARSAIPALQILLLDDDSGLPAAEALSHLGSEGITALSNCASTNNHVAAKACLVFRNGAARTNEAARLTVLAGLTSDDLTVRIICSNALAHLKGVPIELNSTRQP